MVFKLSEAFLGDELCHYEISNQHFRDILCLHHQGFM